MLGKQHETGGYLLAAVLAKVLEISTESNLAAVVDTKEQSEATIRQRRREAETGLKEGDVAAIGCYEMRPHKVMRQMEPLGGAVHV